MQNFIRKPNIDLYPGIRVDKNTSFQYKNEKVEQKLDNLVFHSVAKIEGDGFKSTNITTINLNEGDVLLLEDEDRGYIKPVYPFVSIEEAIDDLMNIKDLG
jgi:hypothetical protein